MLSLKKAGVLAGLCGALLCWSSCGDYYRPTALPIVTPGGQPQPIHYVYALFTNPIGTGNGPGPGTVEQIDVSGDSITSRVTVGIDPLFESYIGSSTGEVFTANNDGSVTEQSFGTVQPPSVTTLPVGTTPVALGSRQADAEYVIASSAPSVCPNGAVVILTTANVVTNTICVGKNPVRMTQVPNGGRVYVINQGDDTVSVIDPVSESVIATVPVGSNPVAAATDLTGQNIFIVNQGSNSLTVINNTDESTSTIATGTAPNFAIFDPHRNRMYVTNGGSNDVTVLDLSQATPQVLLQSVKLGSGDLYPTGVVPLADGTRYYVANTTSNTVTVLDASSNTVVGSISLGPFISNTQPLWIESEPTSTKVYVTTPAPPAGTNAVTNPNNAAGITIIRTDANSISNFQQAPQADPNCQINPASGATCAFQVPVQILSYPR